MPDKLSPSSSGPQTSPSRAELRQQLSAAQHEELALLQHMRRHRDPGSLDLLHRLRHRIATLREQLGEQPGESARP